MARTGLQFGTQESLKCLDGIKPFEIQTTDGSKEVCYAARVATDSIFFPWRTYIKDYVFYPGGDSYFSTTKNTISSLQSEGTLPVPLPIYSISKMELIVGNGLWVFIGIVLAYNGIASLFKNKERK